MIEPFPSLINEVTHDLAPWATIAVEILLALLATMLVHRFGTRWLRRLAAPFSFLRKLVEYTHRTGMIATLLVAISVILDSNPDSLPGMSSVRHFTALLLAFGLTWLGVECVSAVADTIIELNPAQGPNDIRSWRIQTQAKVLSRAMMVFIVLIGLGAGFMTLPILRQIGASFLASAGVAGLVVGLAARPVLSNLLAGIQIALTQPIRLQDVVIVENEWGVVEEISGTYVVVQIWDQRRMIVPLQWFIEHPFQNWTRSNSELMGTVLIWADYRLPFDLFRKEAERICRGAPEWDRRVCVTQLVETSEHAVQLRVLVSADDAGHLWDLRCRMREGLVQFMHQNFPDCLPRIRTDMACNQDGRCSSSKAES